MSVIIPQMDDPSWRTSGIINRINPPSIPTGRRHSLPPLKHFPKPKKFLRKFQPIQHPTSALQRCQIRPQSAAIIISFSYICLGFVSIISPLSFSFLFSFFLIFFSLHFDDFYDPKRQVKKTLVENGAYLIYSAWLPPSAACHSNNNTHTHKNGIKSRKWRRRRRRRRRHLSFSISVSFSFPSVNDAGKPPFTWRAFVF